MPPEVAPKVESAAPAPASVPVAPATTPTPEPTPVVPLPAAKAPEPAKVEATPPAPAPAKTEEATPIPPPPSKSLLGEAGKSAPDEKAKPTEPVKAEPVTPPESAITYEPFKLPEGFEVDTKDMGEFVDILKEFKAPQEFGQKALDLYTRELTKLAEHQQKHWNKTLDDWKADTMADPQIGGNRFPAVLKRCGDVLNEFASPEFRQMLDISGIGNHPEMFRFLNKVAEFVGEPKPVAAQKPAPQPKPSRAQRRYGGNGAQPTGP